MSDPVKTAAVVRLGAHGDALWASSVIAGLKCQEYDVTVYTEDAGELVLRHDPHIDRFILVPKDVNTVTGLFRYLILEARKYDRFVNLVGSVEGRILAAMNDFMFYMPYNVRHQFCNFNYLEACHDFAELPHEWAQRFYPTEEELHWARAEREKLSGPLVVVAPGGGSITKWWPHAQRLMDALAIRRIHTVLLGDLRGHDFTPPEPWARVVGMDWPLRNALSFALVADVVVGVESVFVNAVAFEPMRKVVLLSHSSLVNLTKHWTNTTSIEPTGLDCFPCHRIHKIPNYCKMEQRTNSSACHYAVPADFITDLVVKYLAPTRITVAEALVV